MVDGVSRVSLAAARDRLDSLALSVDVADLQRLSGDLAGVAVLLEQQYALRRALTDPGSPGDRRATLVTRVLRERVGDAALDLLSGVVRARWSQPADLVEAVGLLAAEATLALAQASGGLDEVEDELFRFARIIAGDSALGLALSAPAVPLVNKNRLVHSLLDGRVREETISLLEQAIAEGGGRSLGRGIDALLQLAAHRRSRALASIRSAVPLTSEQTSRLAAALQAAYGRPVQLNVEIDPSLMGGLAVTIGDWLIDGTVLHRLDRARLAVMA